MFDSKTTLVVIGAVLVVSGMLAVKLKLVTVTQVSSSRKLKISILLCLLVSLLSLVPALVRLLGRI